MSFAFDQRVDDRCFRHGSDEEWPVQPASDEFDPEGEY
jgi:hypothetical protein